MNKKILIVSDFAYPLMGGTEWIVMGIAKYLTKKGFEVHIITPNWWYLKNKKFEDDVSFENPTAGKKFFEIEKIKIHRFNWPLMRFGPSRIAGYISNIIRLDKKEDFGILHGFFIVAPMAATITAGRILNKKKVLTLFEFEPLEEHFNNGVKRKIILDSLNKADAVTTLSFKLKERMQKYFPAVKINPVLGWNVSNYYRPLKINKPKEKIILFVGRISKQKGCHVLIKSMPKILKKAKCKLILIGPQWEKEYFSKLIGELELKNSVEFKGTFKREELIKYFNKATVTVLPSIRKEGFGMVLVEAMSCGCPIIGTNEGGIPDAIGNAGIIVPKNNSKKLAESIIKVLVDKKFYGNLRKKSLERAKKFREEKILGKYIEIYEGLINEKK